MGKLVIPKGFYFSGVRSGIKSQGLDLGAFYTLAPASVGAVFTKNQVKAAPVVLSQTVLTKGKLQGIIVNSGNANAVTGEQGWLDALEMQRLFAQRIGVYSELIAVASTGVIGQHLPMGAIRQGISELSLEKKALVDFQEAIMTTDVTTKGATGNFLLGEETVTITGVTKGSGMIHPNMGTMLAFLATDANISSALLQKLLRQATDQSFNQITVDGDTSTNDSCFIMASGACGEEIKEGTPAVKSFYQLLEQVMVSLAKQIAQDGEGATKLVEVQVSGATTNEAANIVAKAVVGSSLVKAAMFGADPNWGRLLSAVGNAPVLVDPLRVDLFLCQVPIFIQGTPSEFNSEALRTKLQAPEILVEVNLHAGNKKGRAWGCDLSYEYVKINAHYHT